MAGIDRVFIWSGSRSEKAKKIAAAALIFLLLGGTSPAVAGQMLNQSQNQGALTQNPDQGRFPLNEPNFSKPDRKQKQAMLDLNYKKLKKHADDLAELATSLQKEIANTNENVLSLEIVKKAEQVEKLAKQIKDEAKGY
ncbi:MAG TPA: hypothetical protein VFC10_08210 [Terriglobia bacterium]|jgi:hypothetical protein|nr:hypothetical protein [Terriglobia bacterium]